MPTFTVKQKLTFALLIAAISHNTHTRNLGAHLLKHALQNALASGAQRGRLLAT